MNIQLTAEDERLVQKRLQSGEFLNAEQVIHEALAAQDADAAWFLENKAEISEKILRGIAQLERGEGISEQAAKAHLEERKADWFNLRKK